MKFAYDVLSIQSGAKPAVLLIIFGTLIAAKQAKHQEPTKIAKKQQMQVQDLPKMEGTSFHQRIKKEKTTSIYHRKFQPN
jgi:hypothetical protein